jgi:Bacterial PH domain
VNEHEFEPEHGLPEPLPRGERQLWQGAPEWTSVARRAFHAGPIAIYFGVLLAWRAGTALLAGEGVTQAAIAVLWLAPLALAALAILAVMAWLTARTTVYTITDRRIVMRVGIVLSVTFNLPFRVIQSAGLLTHADGTGDIPIALAGEDRISYLHLWPHARPWRVARPQPMLRCVPDAAGVAAILSRAVAASQGTVVRQVARAPVVEVPAAENRPLVAAR